jgi:hypothetical protein
MDLGAGVIAMATGSEGEVLGSGTTRYGIGAGRVDYRENLAVQSSSVPAGTPVTIRLRYRIAFGQACLHDLDPALVAAAANQTCLTELELRAVLDDLLGGAPVATQRHLENVGFAPDKSGLFADPGQLGELVVSVQVGDPLRLELFVDASGLHALAPHAATLPTAATGTSLVVVFGIESDTPGVEIVSPLVGGALPGFAGVTPANAVAHALAVDVGAPVTVPEPHAAPVALLALALLGRLHPRAPGSGV